MLSVSMLTPCAAPVPEFPSIDVPGQTHRLIASRFPTVGVFDGLADTEEDLRVLFELEMLANPRLQAGVGRLARIPKGGVASGPTANQVMAAFVHCHEDGGRFNDGRLGAWYAALDVQTGIAETVHHLTRRLSLSEGGFPQTIQMRELVATVRESCLDLCGQATAHAALYDPNDYSTAHNFAASVRWPFAEGGVAGLRYDSVRQAAGVNVCVFKPTAIALPVAQGGHYQYAWNANGEISIAKLTRVTP